MYESEANGVTGSAAEIPADILARFAETRRTVKSRTMIPWGEHCTECVWPTCYATCELYDPRQDGKCRRFVQGMVRLEYAPSLNSYLLRITFKRWAKLWSFARLKLYSLQEADRREHLDIGIASCIQFVPLAVLKRKLTHKRYSWKKRVARRGTPTESPTCLLIECYNPNASAVFVSLTIRAASSEIPFQLLLPMAPGFNRHRVPASDISRVIDFSSEMEVDLTPNDVSHPLTLYFGALDFVIELPDRVTSRPATNSVMRTPVCKCVVWDLDNTLWEGTLIEHGPQQVRLKPRIHEILNTLDERGILISAVSKNNYEDAMAVLKQFGIAHYFLFPQISWNAKSEGIQEIARCLNIGLDSLLFIDDSTFEREQVRAACPEVSVLDAANYVSVLNREECHALVTEESRNRRLFYREQEVRHSAHKHFQGDYLSFLRSCDLRLTIRRMAESNLERVHELTQRTNQMNFSGTRYSREQLSEILARSDLDTYVLDCGDRFGSYGTIGFCTVQWQEPRMTDLMFSCRIQAKRVEHAFLTYLIRKYRENGAGDFYVDYRKTAKNIGPGKVFTDLAFEVVEAVNGVMRLVFRKQNQLSDDGIVTVIAETSCKSGVGLDSGNLIVQ